MATPRLSSCAERHRRPKAHVRPSGSPTVGIRGCHASVSLIAEDSRVRDARRFTRAVLDRWHVAEDSRDCATLIVGELAANAARHGRAGMTVSLALSDGVLYITVTDYGPPAACPPSETTASPRPTDPDERGRGLHIVDALADWTAFRQGEHGTRVQAEVRVDNTTDR
jgi:anti-sigma regulatory factor (Ser/Thr protein kinase)